MNLEHKIIEHLQQTPELPSDLFEKIDKKITHDKVIKRTLFSIAAVLLLSISSMSIAIYHKYNNTLDKEVVAELQEVLDFVNLDDLDSDSDLYAILDNY